MKINNVLIENNDNIEETKAYRVLLNYDGLWNDKNKFHHLGRVLLSLTNFKANKIMVLDFETIINTNRLLVTVKQEDDIERIINYLSAEVFNVVNNRVECIKNDIVEVWRDTSKLVNLLVEDEDFNEVFISIEYS